MLTVSSDRHIALSRYPITWLTSFAAILGTHIRADTVTGSSRIKDLVDIALIATTQQISGPALRAAVLAGAAHRNLSLPDAFAVPDEAVAARLPAVGGRCARADANFR
jgi:hypothetical protein